MLAMTHPAGIEATCVSLDQFEAVHKLRGWQLVVDDTDRPVEVDEKVPAGHIPHTPIHPTELRDTTPNVNTSNGDDDADDDGEPVAPTRPEED